MKDCIIIGTGVAGISAALTLKALKIDFEWLGSPQLSYKIRVAENIKNYAGLPSVSGSDMHGAFLRQIEDEGLTITDKRVNGVYPVDGGYSVMCGGDAYGAKTVIVATGIEAVKPVAGEREFLGRGVSYCAVCDGFLYKDKTIAVAVESAEEAHEVQLLAQYARTVYLFCLKKKFEVRGDNIKIMDGRLDGITGDMRVRAVVSGGEEIPVDGVFMLKSAVAADNLVHGLKTEGGHVVVDRSGATNLAGVFAAGDITGRPYQYAKAAGEGNVCAYSVNAYLNSIKVGN